jgi:[acyl-carrier-protein] S-malonyltransferase
VLGLAAAEVDAACRSALRDGEVVVPANLNTADQIVISGDEGAVTRASAECRRRGAQRVIPLKVSGAFHSPLMRPVVNQLQLALERAPFRDPAFPVIANATAEAVKDAGRARRLLADQVTAPVRWVACMEHAARLADEETRWIEIGPGAVLGALLPRIVPDAEVLSLGTADEVERFLDAAA